MSTRVSDTAQKLVEAHLDAGNTVQFTVPTSSMSPILAPGDRVMVKRVRAVELTVGDLVVQKLGRSNDAASAWMVHRLIQKQTESDSVRLITKGDNASLADAPWTETGLSGRVVSVRKNGSARAIDLTTRRARFFARLFAFFSMIESRVNKQWGGFAGRMIGKANRLMGDVSLIWLAH